MKQRVPGRLTVLVDNREKNPISIPDSFVWTSQGKSHLIQLTKESVRLAQGDYALKGFEDRCLIERKGGLSELHQNLCTGDEFRFRSALRRMCDSCEVPILWLDCPFGEMFEPSRYVDEPDRVLEKLLRVTQEFGVQLLWVPPASSAKSASRSGQLLVRTLWAGSRAATPRKTTREPPSCVACGLGGLEWNEQSPGYWRLIDEQGDPHTCDAYTQPETFRREDGD